jgi:hypothetical protein
LTFSALNKADGVILSYSTCDNTREDYARLRLEESPLRLLRLQQQQSKITPPPSFVSVKPPFVLKSPLAFSSEAQTFQNPQQKKGKHQMPLSLHNYKFILNVLVDIVIYIRSDNKTATLEEICQALDKNIENFKMHGIDYVLELRRQQETELEAELEASGGFLVETEPSPEPEPEPEDDNPDKVEIEEEIEEVDFEVDIEERVEKEYEEGQEQPQEKVTHHATD